MVQNYPGHGRKQRVPKGTAPSEPKPPRGHAHRSRAAPTRRSLTSLLGAEHFQHQASAIQKQIWHMKLNLVSTRGGEGAGMHVSAVHAQHPGEKPCHRRASLPPAPRPIPVSAPGEMEQLAASLVHATAITIQKMDKIKIVMFFASFSFSGQPNGGVCTPRLPGWSCSGRALPAIIKHPALRCSACARSRKHLKQGNKIWPCSAFKHVCNTEKNQRPYHPPQHRHPAPSPWDV